MPSPASPQLKLIDTQAGLAQLTGRLQNQALIAVDTESNSLYAYQEKVCLIQFSIPAADYLVDPIALQDLQPLKSIFTSPTIEKVFHGAEYDLMCLQRDFGFQVRQLFDTRVAARTLGWTQTGLADLVLREFDFRINKRFQRANWGKRPLSPEMLEYAALDTRYLLRLRKMLMTALEEAGRTKEALEACTYLAHIDPSIREGYDPDGYWRLSHSKRLTPRQTAVLSEIYAFRDRRARDMDLPPFKVLGDPVLLSLAVTQPNNMQEMEQKNGLSKIQLRRFGPGLIDAIRKGRAIPPPTRPPRIRPKASTLNRYDALRKWRARTAKARNVESDVILPRDVLWSIAENPPQDRRSLQRIMTPLTWRFEQYSADIMGVLEPKKKNRSGKK